jgi:hypothetical protein
MGADGDDSAISAEQRWVASTGTPKGSGNRPWRERTGRADARRSLAMNKPPMWALAATVIAAVALGNLVVMFLQALCVLPS